MIKRISIITLLLVILSFSITSCGVYNDVKKYEAVGIVKDTYSRLKGMAGKCMTRKYYTIIEYEGQEYKLLGREPYMVAKELIDKEIPLNVEEYLKNGEIVSKKIDIDYYK